MKRTNQLITLVQEYGAHNYHPLSVVLKKGKGSRVWDVEGKTYLDFLSSYSALNFGHSHPKLVQKLKSQVNQLAVCSRAFYSEELSLFSKELANFVSIQGGSPQVLPMNSGAEAVETAIKLVRKWGYEKKKIANEQAHIVAMKNNFHGRTISILSFSTENLYQKNYGPFTPGFSIAEYCNIQSLKNSINKNTVGVILEPIQAEAGIIVPPKGYLKQVRELCDEKGILLILDEIQTGLGRTGKNFCYEHEGIMPDVLVLGKSLGGGLLPVSACIASRKVMEVIRPGEHGSTFGGNPLACALARESLKILKSEKLAQRAKKLGDRVLRKLNSLRSSWVKEVRGMGLLIGIELNESAGGARKYCEKLANEGVLCKETHDHVIRIAPPLNISEKDLEIGINKIIQILN